jgi:hypothetical protein
VQNGNTLGVDFKALYGFYAYFFWAVQTLFFGGVSIWATVLIMGALLVISNLSMYITLCKLIKSRLIAVLSMFSIIFFTQLFTFTFSTMAYYQYIPLRIIFPALTMLMLTLSHTSSIDAKKKLYFITAAILSAFGVFWNPETGIISVVTVIAYCAYQSAEKHYINSKAFWKSLIKPMIIIVSSIFIATGALNIFTFVRSGAILTVTDIFWGIIAVMGDGYFMLPLPEGGHPYTFVLFIYSVALIFTIAKLKLFRFKAGRDNIGTPKDDGEIIEVSETTLPATNYPQPITCNQLPATNYPLLFALSVLGFGLFSYFLGRSHLFTFAVCLWPLFVIVPYLCEKFIDTWKNRKSEAEDQNKGAGFFTGWISGGIAVLTFVVIFITGFSVFTVNEHPGVKIWNNFKLSYDVVVTGVISEFVFTHHTENMAFIDMYSPFIMSHTGLKNDYKGSSVIDYLFKQDYIDLLDFVRNYQGRLFMAHDVAGRAIPLEQGMFNELLAEIIAENFSFVTEGHGIVIYDRLP